MNIKKTNLRQGRRLQLRNLLYTQIHYFLPISLHFEITSPSIPFSYSLSHSPPSLLLSLSFPPSFSTFWLYPSSYFSVTTPLHFFLFLYVPFSSLSFNLYLYFSPSPYFSPLSLPLFLFPSLFHTHSLAPITIKKKSVIKSRFPIFFLSFAS